MNSKEHDTIFLVTENGDLERVPRSDYASEEILQALIEKHPDLLSGDQMGGDETVRWLLVCQIAPSAQYRPGSA